MNVDRCWLGTSLVRFRVFPAALMLLVAGCMLLGWNSLRPVASQSSEAASPIALGNQLAPASLLATNDRPITYAAAHNASDITARLPLIFEPNRGQANLDPTDRRAQFIARASGYTLVLGSEGALVAMRSREAAKDASAKHIQQQRFESIWMKLAGSNPHAALVAADPLPGKSNYLLGSDSARWRTGIPQFARVRYENIYPGINLVFYGQQGRMEYDFQVEPGSNPSQAELQFDGAKALELRDGALVIREQGGDLRFEAPRVYQQVGGREESVEGSFVLRSANRVGFAIGAYDHSRELVIDPVLSFSSYFGGAGDELNSSVAVDTAGNVYLAGSTNSPTLPGLSSSVLQSTLPGVRNVYIAKITPGNPPTLDYVTYLGGAGTDTPAGIAVDAAEEPFLAGTTSSANFPHTPTAYQTAPEGGPGPHVFVTKLDSTASSLLYSSYLSGNTSETATGMTIDGGGNLYVTGTTQSTDQGSAGGSQFPASSLPYATPFQSLSLATTQFFVTKVNTANAGRSSIAYSTYFGGATTANGAAIIATGGGITVDTNLNIYFSGTTNFTYTNGAIGDFPILNAFQPCLNQQAPIQPTNPPTCSNSSTSSASDAFLAKITPPTPNGIQGQQLQWSTYFGGTGTDSSTGIAVDAGAANVYIVGTTDSPSITGLTTFAGYQLCLDTPVNPTTGLAGCTAPASPAPNDAFVARFTNPTPSSTTTVNMGLTYFSYLGGTGDEEGQAITVDSGSGAIVTGSTRSTDFPVSPANSNIQSHINGPRNAFIARLNTTALTGQNTVASWASYYGGNNTDEGTSVTLDVNQNTYFAGDTNSTALLQVTGPFTTNAGGFDAFVTELSTAASMTISGVLTLGTNQTFISAGNPATFTYTLTNTGPDLATNITVSDDLTKTGWPVTFNSATATSGTCSTGSATTAVVCTIPSLQAGSTATVTIVLTPTANPSGSQESFNGGTVQVVGPNNIGVLAKTSVSAQMSDFTLSVSPPNFSVAAAGDTARYNVQLNPNPVYGTNIAMACSGLPTAAACTFTTPTVTLQGTSPGATTLSISTTARPITSNFSKGKDFYAVWLLIPGLAFVAVGRDRRRCRIAGFLMLCALFTQLLLLPACSHTNTQPPTTGTPAGTSTITVTATAGSDVKSQAVKLTVP